MWSGAALSADGKSTISEHSPNETIKRYLYAWSNNAAVIHFNNVMCYNIGIVTDNIIIFYNSPGGGMAIVSFESVASAAEALQAAGTRPSVRNVIEELGGGSPNSVLKYLREWQSGRPLVRASDIELDESITSAIREQMQNVATEAAKAAEDKAAAVEDDLQTLTDAHAEAERTIEALKHAVEDLKSQAQVLTVELETAKSDAQRAVEQHVELVGELRNQVASERQRADVAAAKLTTAEVRLEALPAIQAEVEKLRAGIAELQESKQRAEQAAAVAQAKAEALEAAKAASDARAADAEKEARAARQGEQHARIAEQAAQARIESAVRELDQANKAIKEARAETKAAQAEASELRGQLLAAAQKD